jgi:hypothetical protein
MEATRRRLIVGAGWLILAGLFLTKLYGWWAGANLIENGIGVLLIVRMVG